MIILFVTQLAQAVFYGRRVYEFYEFACRQDNNNCTFRHFRRIKIILLIVHEEISNGKPFSR